MCVFEVPKIRGKGLLFLRCARPFKCSVSLSNQHSVRRVIFLIQHDTVPLSPSGLPPTTLLVN